MDIAKLSLSMSQNSLLTDVGTAVLKNSLDCMETEGESIQKILESSVNPNIGQNIDISL